MRRGVLSFGLLFAVLLMQVPLGVAADGSGHKVLSWGTAFAVTPPFTGGTNPIRGLSGGGVPWTFKRIKGELSSDGDLEIQIRGLVVESTGSNPVPFFLATVSCVSVDSTGVVNANVSTVQADTDMIGDPTNGNAMIKATVSLPSPCLAPVVFVTSPGHAWFAVTGISAPTSETGDSPD